jgi:hypothetical protein
MAAAFEDYVQACNRGGGGGGGGRASNEAAVVNNINITTAQTSACRYHHPRLASITPTSPTPVAIWAAFPPAITRIDSRKRLLQLCCGSPSLLTDLRAQQTSNSEPELAPSPLHAPLSLLGTISTSTPPDVAATGAGACARDQRPTVSLRAHFAATPGQTDQSDGAQTRNRQGEEREL